MCLCSIAYILNDTKRNCNFFALLGSVRAVFLNFNATRRIDSVFIVTDAAVFRVFAWMQEQFSFRIFFFLFQIYLHYHFVHPYSECSALFHAVLVGDLLVCAEEPHIILSVNCVVVVVAKTSEETRQCVEIWIVIAVL